MEPLEYDQGIFAQIQTAFEELYNSRGKPVELDEAFATEFLGLTSEHLAGERASFDAQAATVSLQSGSNLLVDTTIRTENLSFVAQTSEPVDRRFWRELVGSMGKNIKQALFRCVGQDQRSATQKMAYSADGMLAIKTVLSSVSLTKITVILGHSISGYGQSTGTPIVKGDAASLMSKRVEGFLVMVVHGDAWTKRFLHLNPTKGLIK
ncbi:hypothetical protein FRC09_005320 [Ceratobasidium sp. 395]|nr:hypothetical protein FRC09_005320 [Ceratobasidium sp. 395]